MDLTTQKIFEALDTKAPNIDDIIQLADKVAAMNIDDVVNKIQILLNQHRHDMTHIVDRCWYEDTWSEIQLHDVGARRFAYEVLALASNKSGGQYVKNL